MVSIEDKTKPDMKHMEHDENASSAKEEEGSARDDIAAIDEKLESRIKRKVDVRLLPILAALYTICLLDRTNIGGARISGLDEAVGLDVGNRASVIILIFYVGYIMMELPSNIALRKFGAANWMSFLGVAWGLVVLGFGFSKNWQTVAVLRVLLGILEAGLFPACIYLVGSWYTKYEVQKRIAVVFLTASFLSSFANILAYGLTQIASDPELGGWKWIFIIEGAITIVIAVIAWFAVIDFPDSKRNTFLSPEQVEIINARLLRSRGTLEGGKVTWRVVRETVTDWQVWTIGLVYMSGSCATYGYLFFLPIILRRGLGYSQQMSFLLTAPPSAVAVIYAFALSWVADRYRVRGPFVLLHCTLGIVGLCMIGFLDSPTPRYVGTFLGAASSNSLIVSGLAWGQNNVRGDARRSVVTAIFVMLAGVGGIYSALVFRQVDAPNYLPGVIATGALILLAAVLTLITCPLLIRANRQADAGKRTIEGSTDFRYTW